MVGFRHFHRLDSRLKVGPGIERHAVQFVGRRDLVRGIKWARDIKLAGRRTIVQQHQNLDFRVRQGHPGAFQVRFVLHALQFEAIEIYSARCPPRGIAPG